MNPIRVLLLSIALWSAAPSAAEVPATIEWARKANLGLAVSGVVERVAVAPGDRVEQGQELLRLDQREFRTEVARARARLVSTRAELDEARREDQRAVELYERTVLSDHERQLAQIALRAAESAHQVARADLSAAELALERSALRAPFAGEIASVDASPGEVIVTQLESRVLVGLVDTGVMRARAWVPARSLAGVEVGMTAGLQLAGRRLAGRVTLVGREPGPAGNTYPVLVEFAVPAGVPFRVGETVNVNLELETD